MYRGFAVNEGTGELWGYDWQLVWLSTDQHLDLQGMNKT
jgi:hypothetical protein